MKNNRWIKYLDYVFITRPMLFFPGWNTLLAGYLIAVGEINFVLNITQPGFEVHLWNTRIAVLMFSFLAAMGGSFILNQVQDVETDRKNQKLFLVGNNHISRRSAIFQSAFLLLTALITGWLLNWQVLALTLLFILITSYFYNFSPFRFKDRALWGLILNMLMGWLAFLLGGAVVGQIGGGFLFRSLPYLFLNTSLYFITTLPDTEGDRAVDKFTVSVVFGKVNTIRMSAVCYILSIIFAFLTGDAFLILLNLLVLYWVFRMVISRSVKGAVKYLKMTILFFSILICFKFPAYFFVMAFVFFLTKYYYLRRFQFNYPNFRGE